MDNTPESLNGDNKTNGTNGTGSNSWLMWQRLVLSEIEQNKKDNEDNTKEINELKIKFAVMQTKMLLAGAAISAAMYGFFGWLFDLFKSKP